MNGLFFLAIGIPVAVMFLGAIAFHRRQRNVWTFLQLVGTGAFIVVVLAHIVVPMVAGMISSTLLTLVAIPVFSSRPGGRPMRFRASLRGDQILEQMPSIAACMHTIPLPCR
jgi:hypothetical protein